MRSWPAALWLLGAPVLLWQGHQVRRNTPRLPEPEGERQGSQGLGPPLRLLVLGDSSAAGVGVSHFDASLIAQLVKQLAPQHQVSWQLIARSGWTTADALKALSCHELQADVALIALGVNDIIEGLSRRTWIRQQRQLIRHLRDAHGLKHILLSAPPPMRDFPALPTPLRFYLGARADAFHRALRALSEELHCHLMEIPQGSDTPLAADGFHPGATLYARWAASAANKIEDLLRPA